jgi:hypothetical protein
MSLVNQPSFLPTRKMMAVIISGAIMGAVNQLLNIYWPEHPFIDLLDDVEIWLQMGIMVVAGYMTQEKVNVQQD